MADFEVRPWAGKVIFAGVALAIIVLRLMPFDTEPRPWPGPDVLLAVTLVFVTRRPAMAPVTLIAAIFLLADFLFLEAPGLKAALVVIGTEWLRRRSRSLRMGSFMSEWALVGALIGVIAIVTRAVQVMLLVQVPRLGPVLIEALVTAAIYPLVAIVAATLLGLRRPAPGAVDQRGQKI